MLDLLPELERQLTESELSWWRDALARCARDGAQAAALVLPALPRRLGRHGLRTGTRRAGDATFDLGVWRACDVGALAVLEHSRAGDDATLALFAHGDIEERTMLLRATTARELSAATATLLSEIQRSNTLPHFEALACDSDLVARACGRIAGFGIEQLDRLVLKAAFLGLRLRRLHGVERHANAELSRMLQDLATEREAAGRQVWPDTALLIGRAPVPGTAARLLGDLEHGDDERRAAAVVGLALVRRSEFLPYLVERLPREPRAAIQQALRDAIAQLS